MVVPIYPEPIRPGKKVIRRAEVVLLKKQCMAANDAPMHLHSVRWKSPNIELGNDQ